LICSSERHVEHGIYNIDVWKAVDGGIESMNVERVAVTLTRTWYNEDNKMKITGK